MVVKSTDIAKNCGLDKVLRLERGLAYYITCDTLSVEQQKQLDQLLHDRMMETVFTCLTDASSLFHSAEPSALTAIDIENGGRGALAQANIDMGLALAEDEIDYLFVNFPK